MRISTNTIFDLGMAGIQQQTSDLIKSQQQVSTGRRILSPSDDPVASARVLDLTQSQSLNKQYDTNITSATSNLGLEESILGSVGNLVQDAQSVAVYAGNPTLDNDNRLSLATELRSRYKELLGLANTTDGNGNYLFSGYKGATQPFGETAPGTVAYTGDEGQRLTQISPSRQIAVSDSGSNVFQRIKNGNGTFVSRAATSNAGAGVIDPGTVSDPLKWLASKQDYTIRFAANTDIIPNPANTGTASVTAGIVDQAAWDAGGKNLLVSFAGAAAPFTYTVTDTVSGANTTGSYTPGATPLTLNFEGADIVLNGTPVAGDSFTIAPAAKPGWTYDIIDNTTLPSATSKITGKTPPTWSSQWRSYTSGQTISLTSQGAEPAFDFGASTKIEGDPAAGDTFTVKASQNEDLFTVLNNLITTLEKGTNKPADNARLRNDLNLAMSGLSNVQTNVSTVRASVGARMKEIDSVKSTGEDLQLQYQQSISQLQDLDYAKAITDLTRQQVSLEAAQKSFMKVQGLSLFDFM